MVLSSGLALPQPLLCATDLDMEGSHYLDGDGDAVDDDQDEAGRDLQSQEIVLVLQDRHRPAYHPAAKNISPSQK